MAHSDREPIPGAARLCGQITTLIAGLIAVYVPKDRQEEAALAFQAGLQTTIREAEAVKPDAFADTMDKLYR